MKVKYQDTLVSKIENRIKNINGQVVLCRDFADLSDKTQISRVLRVIVKNGKLVKLGYGVFAKPLFYSERLKRPVINFPSTSREALTRLGIKWELGKAAQDYNAGRSTQVPVNVSVKIIGRSSRRLACGNARLRYE